MLLKVLPICIAQKLTKHTGASRKDDGHRKPDRMQCCILPSINSDLNAPLGQ